jgi:hypothetical protein
MNILERIAHYADIDTRRAMGFPPRKLPPSDLKIRVGKTWWYVGRPFTEVNFENNLYIRVVANEQGNIRWAFDMRKYEYERP